MNKYNISLKHFNNEALKDIKTDLLNNPNLWPQSRLYILALIEQVERLDKVITLARGQNCDSCPVTRKICKDYSDYQGCIDVAIRWAKGEYDE